MPTYEYICQACHHEFELFQQMSDAVKRKCPECGRLKLQRLIVTGAGVIFKGGGCYETDYRSDSYKKAAEAEKNRGGIGDVKSAASENGSTKGAGDAKPAKNAGSSRNESSGKSGKPNTSKAAE